MRLLDGIAIGGMLPVCWALNIEYVAKRYRATIVTLIMIGYSVGLSAGGPVANWLMPRYGWAALFVFGGGLSLLAMLALLVALPESIRFLVSQGRGPEIVARLLRRLAPDRPVAADAIFTLGDEAPPPATLFADRPRWQAPLLRLTHVLGVLFAGSLRWITPLLWLAYIFSSMAVFFFATWSPLVFEALGYSRGDAAWAASVNALAGALGGLLLMRFTDAQGAIAVGAMPLVAAPLLLAAGFVDLGYWGFLGAVALISLFLIGGHFGLHSIAGIFYPSAYRGNGAGWAISVAKIGAIAGPWIAGDLLSAGLPVRSIYAVVAVCPAVFVVAIAVVGVVHRRLLRRDRGDAAAEVPPRLAPAAPG